MIAHMLVQGYNMIFARQAKPAVWKINYQKIIYTSIISSLIIISRRFEQFEDLPRKHNKHEWANKNRRENQLYVLIRQVFLC